MYYELPSNGGARSLVSVNASVKKFLEEPAKDPIRQVMVKAIDTVVRYALQIVQSLKQNSPFFVRTICRDLLTVLCLPKWPAAELLLRALLPAMLNVAEDKRASTLARKTALEIMGSMGVAISCLYDDVQKAGIAVSEGPQPLIDCLTASDV